MHRFLERRASLKLNGTYIKLLNQVEKAILIFLDEFGPTLSTES